MPVSHRPTQLTDTPPDMPVDRRLKLLLLSDLDGQSSRVTALCEQVVCSRDHDVDAVVVCDGFVSASEPVAYDVPEKKAAAEGDMMSLISRLETIVCRVIYSPGENDPPTTRPLLPVAPNLTQYSVNCFFKREILVPGIGIVGEIGYHCSFGEGRDPAEHLDLLLVLRNQHALTPLPAPHLHHVEIIGGPSDIECSPDKSTVYPGSLRLGQFTILELARDALDGTWTIASSRREQLVINRE